MHCSPLTTHTSAPITVRRPRLRIIPQRLLAARAVANGQIFLLMKFSRQNAPMDYYSVDCILACEEKVQVAFSHQIDNFGFYINPSLQSIRPNTRAELPFFLVGFLLQNDHCVLTSSQVSVLKDDLDADAAIVDLGNTHFFVLNSYFENSRYLASTLFERLSAFTKLIVKEDFSENDLVTMAYCERAYVALCRRRYKMFHDFYLRKVPQ